jgi:predicted nucleotidyltransferase
MKKKDALIIARRFRDAIRAEGYPIERVILFGSTARNQAVEDSDIDVAVVCNAFAPVRHEENMVFRRIRRTIDLRIEPISLHPDDFRSPAFALTREIEREGVEV